MVFNVFRQNEFTYTIYIYIYLYTGRHINIYTYFEVMASAHLLATAVDLSGIGFICGNEMDIISNDMCKIYMSIGHCSFVYISFFIYLFIFPVFQFASSKNLSPTIVMLLCVCFIYVCSFSVYYSKM